MSEENKPTESNRQENKSDQKASAGQRLDQFISGAKRLGVVTGQKAKEMADAAAPRLKELGDAASETASRAFANRSTASSLFGKVRAFYNAGGAARKGLLIYGGLLGGLLVLSLLSLPFILMLAGALSSGTRNASSHETFWTRHPGHWVLEVKKTNFSMLFRFDVQNEAISHFESGVKTGNDERWGGPDANGVQFAPAGNDDATVTFTLVAKTHELKVHAEGKDVTGTTADGDAVSGQIIASSSPNESGGSVAIAQKAMLDIGSKYSPIDGQLAAAAIEQHRVGVPWSEIDSTMRDASNPMQRAYKDWKSACDRVEK